MKKIVLISVMIVTAFTTVFAFGDHVEGNGKVVKEDRTVKGFDKIRVSDGLDLFITQGDKEELTLEVDENLLQYIKTEVDGGTLKIYSEKNIRKAKSRKVHVTFKTLKALRGSSGSDIEAMNTIKSKEFDIDMSSGSDLKLELEATDVEIDLSSGSDAFIKMKANNVEIDASSGSDVELAADELETIDVSMSSGSDVELHGSAKKMKVRASSGSDLDAYDFVVADADISASSASDIEITVVGKLKAHASSASSVTYKGKVDQRDIDASSLGSVKQR